MGEESELLTTGEVARLLRSSRQHVVDLCERGRLPYVRVGAHRRVRRTDVDALLRPALSRGQLETLWLHHAVAGRLVADPPGVLVLAASNLARLLQVETGAATDRLRRWGAILDQELETVLDVLTARDPQAVDLRQSSPFIGVLSESERRAVSAGFAIWHGKPDA